ncbi:MAG: sirohydrochlorin cobaltochelatase, partial [Lachnospiraceae bacterium]|nr:sirohydrochlorin cobaltochelatase [Lachnospiraceae bacterium]
INRICEETGHKNIVVGTVEFEPGIAPVLAKVKERNPKKVYLAPLLVVAGDHANNDMAGDDEDSWKNQIAKEGPQVECIIRGLGEYEEIRALYVQHAKEA